MRVTSATYDTRGIPSYNAPCNTNFILVTLIYYMLQDTNPPAKINTAGHAANDRARPVCDPLREIQNRWGGCAR